MFSYKHYLAYLFGSLIVSIGLQMILPFPYGLAISLAIFIGFPLIVRKTIRSSGGSGTFFGNMNTKVKYLCLVCNNRFKGDACNRCGSKSKKADF